MTADDIKLGVSLFSFSSIYCTHTLDLEGILKKASEMGYEGIEIVAAQSVPGYPNPSDEWLEEFRGLLKKYNLHLVCWSAYIDMGIRSDRDLSEAEIIQYTRNDLIYAKKAGADLVRTQHAISPAIFRKMLPYCKELGMKLAIEMHSPHHPDVPVWKEYLDIMAEPGCLGWLGIVPDCGIFQHTPHKLAIDMFLEGGFDKAKLDNVIRLHNEKKTEEEILASDSFTEYEKTCIEDIKHRFSAPAKVKDLERLIPYTFYIHGKYHYLPEECNDPTIPYAEIIQELKKLNYKGYIASEFEGHEMSGDDNTIEQLERYITMFNRLL